MSKLVVKEPRPNCPAGNCVHVAGNGGDGEGRRTEAGKMLVFPQFHTYFSPNILWTYCTHIAHIVQNNNNIAMCRCDFDIF